MIKILIVDDSPEKIKSIVEILNCNPELNDENICTCSDLVSARKELARRRFDLLILDLNLPERFGDDPKKFSGLEFLYECKESQRLCKPYHIIGLTQYEELIEEYKKQFDDELWALIHYSIHQNTWKDPLNNKVSYLIQSKKELSLQEITEYDYDLAIITALHDPELLMVIHINANWKKIELSNDPTPYYIGSFVNSSKRLKVVAASANQMGMVASSVLSTKIIENFRPKYLAMTGIAAGLQGKANLGDIIACDLSWDYGSGKISCNEEGKVKFSPDPRSIPLDPEIKEKLLSAQLEERYVNEIKRKFIGNKPNTSLKLVIGPMASGAAVVENEKLIDAIKSQQRKLVGIEMESYGVFYAACNSRKPKPKCMVIKSVCDFADAHKNDDFQKYAAFTSAQFLYEFSLEYF